MKKKIVEGFDIMKFIMAIIVVELHSKGLHAISPLFVNIIIRPLEDISVPLFFVFSSSLFFSKIRYSHNPKNDLSKYVKRIIILYGFWIIVNFPLVYQGKFYIQHITLATPLYFVKDFLTGYLYPSSWFFGALIVSVSFVFLMTRVMKDKVVWIIPFLIGLYIAHVKLLPDDYTMIYDWYNSIFRDPNLSWPRALFYVTLGHLFSNPIISKRISNISTKWLVFIFVLSFFVWQLELFTAIFLGVTSLYFIACKIKTQNVNKELFVKIRVFSIWFYCMHMMFINIFQWIHIHYLSDLRYSNFICFSLVLLILYITSCILYKLKNLKLFNWLQFSY